MNRKYTDEQYDRMVSLYLDGVSVAEICQLLKCEMKAVYRQLKKRDIAIRKTTAALNISEIVDAYHDGDNCTVIADRYEISVTCVMKNLQAQGVELRSMSDLRRSHQCNSSYFDHIDTEQKAYYLGLLYADGCVNPERSRVSLAQKDRTVLKGFRTALVASNPISSSMQKGQTYYEFVVTDRVLAEALARKGCMARKTFSLTFPASEIIPEGLVNHFVRGYFDGDGCIHHRKNSNSYVIHIVGTEAFVHGMAALLPYKTTVRKRSNSSIWYLGISRREDVVSFGKWLYEGATIAMDRKRDLFPT